MSKRVSKPFSARPWPTVSSARRAEHPRVLRACAVHVQRVCSARAVDMHMHMHMQCACTAHAVRMQWTCTCTCTCSAHALHMQCACSGHAHARAHAHAVDMQVGRAGDVQCTSRPRQLRASIVSTASTHSNCQPPSVDSTCVRTYIRTCGHLAHHFLVGAAGRAHLVNGLRNPAAHLRP